LKRIAKEIQNYSDNPHPFVAIFPCSNINLWKILLLGPKSTPYENGLFLLYAQFPGDYPFKAPEVRFITPIYHCNMNSQGRICHSVFDRNYSPALTFRHIIDCVYGLILTPEPEDPLDNVIASFYLSDYQTYVKNAQQFTLEKASLSTEEIVDELFGKIVDDI
jgi:ubiquitin-protein ligase